MALLVSTLEALEAEIERRLDAERQAFQLEQCLAVSLASAGAGFIATDRQGKVTRMNAAAEQLLDWRQDEAVGQDYWEVFKREDRPVQYLGLNPVDVAIQQALNVDIVHRLVAISRTGKRTEVDVQAALKRAEDGSVTGLAIIFRDIGRLVRAEAESQRLAVLVESSSDAIISKTLGGRITSWNAAAQRMLGYSAEEVIGRQIETLIPPDLHALELRVLDALCQGHSVPPFDTVRLTRDGARLDVSVTASPITDAHGRLIGAAMIERDVSVQRRAEAALRASEERLRFTLESARLGDWSLDLATGAVQRGLRHDQCFGYTELQADWNQAKFITHVHPDDCADVARFFKLAVTSLRDWRAEFRVVWPDASVHWLSSHGSVERQGARATRVLGIVSDITAQKLAEEARLQAQRLEVENAQIQQASRLKSEFLANMSHELRTPLNAVIGFAELLQSGLVATDSPQHQAFLGFIATSGQHLLQLINDVLDLSKVESGKFDFFPEAIDLATLLKEVTNVLHTAIQDQGVRVVTAISPELSGLHLDPARLKQVLYNYLSNAIKFSSAGGPITVRAMAAGADHFRLEVEDQGIGIAAPDLPRLFTDFQQLDTGYGKQHQGTGLGLALTRRLIEAQGGSVGVRSRLGEGSVFFAVLNRVHGLDSEHGRHGQGAVGGKQDQRDQARLMLTFSEPALPADPPLQAQRRRRHRRREEP